MNGVEILTKLLCYLPEVSYEEIILTNWYHLQFTCQVRQEYEM